MFLFHKHDKLELLMDLTVNIPFLPIAECCWARMRACCMQSMALKHISDISLYQDLNFMNDIVYLSF